MSTFFRHTLPFLPSDPFSLFQFFNKKKKGFFFGSGKSSPNNSKIFLSLHPPVRRFSEKASRASALLKKLKKQKTENYPFPRFVGFVSFDSSQSFDEGLRRIPFKKPGFSAPSIEFYEYDSVLALDLTAGKTDFFCSGGPQKARKILKMLNRRLESTSPSLSKKKGSSRSSTPPYGPFKKRVSEAKELIQAGEIYQANLSVRFQEKFKGVPFEFFQSLSNRNPSPYACFLPAGSGWIASSSPELLVAKEGNRVWTRPIAGTRPRTKNQKINKRLKGNLLLSPKERAEHVMLIDLERNDLGRVCSAGSVKVTDWFFVENYSHVMHIVSEVEGSLKNGKGWADALEALFPGGTITGCPKIRATEIINDLEPVGRGPFYGSAGYVAWNGDAKFNILIRTAYLQGNKAFYQAGAGIVADSHPKREFKETMAKAAAIRQTLQHYK